MKRWIVHLLLPLSICAQSVTYTNPVIADGADPGLVQHDGMTYVFVTSQYNTVMQKSPDGVTGWSAPKIVYQGTRDRAGWAPSLRKAGDVWHLYTAGAYCTGSSLEGPFELKARALGFDPYCYHDQDGSGKQWFFWGGSHAGNCVAEMETPSSLKPDTGLYFLPPTGWGTTWEGLWVERVNGKYVLMISADSANSPNYRLHYAVSDSLQGPYTLQSDVREAAFLRRSDAEGIYGPGHHAMMQDKHGTWWVYYQQHNDGGGSWNRSIAVDPLWFDASGHPQMRPTRGVARPGPGSDPSQIWPLRRAGDVIEAESYDGSRCCRLMEGGKVVGDFIHAGFIAFRHVEFSPERPVLSVIAANGGTAAATLELRRGSMQGELLAAVNVLPTGGWDKFETYRVRLLHPQSGTNDAVLVVTGLDPGQEALRLDRWQLTGGEAPVSLQPVSMPAPKQCVAQGGTLRYNLLPAGQGQTLVSVNGARSEKSQEPNLSFSPVGDLIYRAPAGYWGTDRIFYTVQGADGALTRGTLTLYVEPKQTARVIDGTAWIEAEDFVAQWPYKDELAWERSSELDGFSGAGYVQTPNEGTSKRIAERAGNPGSAQIDFAVRVSAAGIYRIWARVYAPDAESSVASVSFCTASDVEVRSDINQAWMIQPQTIGQWEWVEVDNPLSIPDGLHRLALRRGQDGLAVDRLLLTADEALDPHALPNPPQPAAPEPDDCFVFSYFMDNGEDGLHLALSRDGFEWTPVQGGEPLFKAEAAGENLMRDPFVMPDPHGNGYHALWTTGWRGRSIGYAHSLDLIHWTSAKAIPVMEHLPETQNAWAPEMIYDEQNGCFIIYFASRIPERYDGHRMWCVTTADFKTFTPARIFYDPGHSVIDAHILRDGERFVMVLKDERQDQKRLKLAFADSPAGPWSAPTEPISEELTEGATALKLEDQWLILYDNYGDHHYAGYLTRDFQSFEPVNDRLRFTGRVRHGTAFRVPRAHFEALRALE